MTVMFLNAGAMPARSPHLKSTVDSFRKLKSALATPMLPHSWTGSSGNGTLRKSLFSGIGNGVPATTRIAAGSSRLTNNGGDEEKATRLHALSSFGGESEEELGKTGSNHYDANSRNSELKSSFTRPRPGKAGTDSSRLSRWIPSPEHNPSHQNFSSGAAFGTDVLARNNGAGGLELGNERSSSSGGSVGFQGVEGDLVREQRRAEFENWAREKFRDAGTTALPAIEEMRQTFAPGSPSLDPHLVSTTVQPERNVAAERNLEYPHTGRRSSHTDSPIADVQKSGMSSSANGGYGRRRVDHRGSSSSPSSRFGAGSSNTRSESWSPRSLGTSRGSRSASNVASRTGVQFPAEESGKTSSGERTSASRSVAKPTQQPLLVKRSTKLPINFYGRAGTVMLVDKPQGWTSFAICSKLRYLLKIQKVGHAGTLDPMATGLLIVCLGKATKLADSYQAMTKVYSGTLRLGELTPSLDADTEVSDVLPWEHITDDQLEQAKQEFVGDIFQAPPMYSAIKVDGERLYVKARKGEHVEIPARLVTVIDFQLERSSENRQDFHFRATCSKGTYIRTLCADLARAVGSYAHLTALRREKIGTYSVKDAWPILEFVEQYSRSRDTVVVHAET